MIDFTLSDFKCFETVFSEIFRGRPAISTHAASSDCRSAARRRRREAAGDPGRLQRLDEGGDLLVGGTGRAEESDTGRLQLLGGLRLLAPQLLPGALQILRPRPPNVLRELLRQAPCRTRSVAVPGPLSPSVGAIMDLFGSG